MRGGPSKQVEREREKEIGETERGDMGVVIGGLNREGGVHNPTKNNSC